MKNNIIAPITLGLLLTQSLSAQNFMQAYNDAITALQTLVKKPEEVQKNAQEIKQQLLTIKKEKLADLLKPATPPLKQKNYSFLEAYHLAVKALVDAKDPDLTQKAHAIKKQLLTLEPSIEGKKFAETFVIEKRIKLAQTFVNHLKMLFELKQKEDARFQVKKEPFPEMKEEPMDDDQLSQSQSILNPYHEKDFDYYDYIYRFLNVQLKSGDPIVKSIEQQYPKEKNIIEFLKKNYFKSLKYILEESDHPKFEKMKNAIRAKEKSIFKEIIDKERNYNQCYVLYHGMSGVSQTEIGFSVLPYIYRTILSWFKADPRYKNVMLRILDKPFRKIITNPNLSPIENYFKEKYKEEENLLDMWHKKYLLSVNPSLFSNLDEPGESSLHMFLISESITQPSYLPKIIEKIFEKFKFDKKYMQDVLNVFIKHLKEKGGQLLQIFVRKDVIDKYAYMSFPWGKKIKPKDFIDQTIINELLGVEIQGESRILPSKVLDLFKQNPTKLGIIKTPEYQRRSNIFSYNEIQLRLLLVPSLLMDQERVKIFTYNAAGGQLSEAEIAKFEKELSDIFAKVFNDWIEQYLEDETAGKPREVEGREKYPLDIMAEIFAQRIGD